MRLEVFLLGRFEVRCNGQPVTHWPRAAARRLLKRLALAPQHTVALDALAEALWPHDHGERLRQRLHHLVYLLRRTLDGAAAGGASCIQSSDGLLRLAPEGLWVDLDDVEAGLSQALQRPDDTAALQAALARQTGPLLPGDLDDDAIDACRARLERRVLQALQQLAARQAAQGALAEAADTLAQVVARAPADEAAHRALIELHARAGRRHEAERQWAECRAALVAELGVAPSAATHQAYRAAMLDPAPPPPADAPADDRFRPPVPLVPLIDRDALVLAIRERLAEPGTRLLTLTGAGGLGKTQLALRVAHELAPAFRHGACVVSLAEVSGDGVLDRLRRALRIAEPAAASTLDALADFLQDRHLLLVCDNGEHVADRLGVLTALLERAPMLKLLATSRRRLNLRPEQVLAVPPLAATRDSAVRLFAERARAVQPAFQLDEPALDEVVAITRRLQGLPLAIELVAARSQLYAPAELRAALDAGFGLVSGGGPDRPDRHRSLEASLAWSRSLLSPLERAVLDRLALLAAPGEPAALAAICADLTPDPGPAVQALAELGLLQRSPATAAGPARLQGLAAGLAAASDGAAVPAGAAALVAWFAGLAARLAAQLAGPQAGEALAAFDADHENFFAALAWARRLDDRAGLAALVRALAPYWARSGAWERADPWVLLGVAQADALPPRERAALLVAAGAYWHEGQQYARARELALQALDLAQAAGDVPGQGRAALLFSSAAYYQGDAALAVAPLQRTLQAAEAAGEAELRRVALNNLGTCHLSAGRLREARAVWLACDAEFDGAREQARVATVYNLALAAHYGGRHAEAMQRLDLAFELEGSAAARPARLALMRVRQAWMWCARGHAAPAAAALQQAREAAAAARLGVWERVCRAHEGKLALVAGQPGRAVALLQRGLHDCQDGADPWDLLDLRLWLFWARQAGAGVPDAAGRVLADLVATAGRAWRHEHPRILEAAAAWLLRQRRLEPAARAWREADALRRREGLRRFPFEQAAARRSAAALRAQPGVVPASSVSDEAVADPLHWLRAALR